MDVLLLSKSDTDGGAARAAYRLHRGLQEGGICSRMMVQVQLSNDPSVLVTSSSFSKLESKLNLNEHIDSLPLYFYRNRLSTKFSPQWFPDRLSSQIARINPDIIHLHWICNGFASIETLAKFKRPIVWTMHDMWAFTGGCHYTENCDRYTKSCGACPQLQSTHEKDLSYWVWNRKVIAWSNLNLTVISPSHWLAECAGRSSLFQQTRVEVIPNGLDTKIYKPLDRRIARDRLNLPQDKLLVLFGATYANDTRKGLHFLQSSLQKLSRTDWEGRIELIIFGASRPIREPNFGFKTHYLGNLNDDFSLALAYAAAEVFTAPSMQDNLPNTIMEALACGTPCVAFNIGGMPDLIEHQHTGYLAQPYDVNDLARGIAWVLDDPDRHAALCKRSRQKAEQEFELLLHAQRYITLYKELLAI